MRMCVWLCGSHFVTQVTSTWLLERTSSTADPMAQATGFPPKVLKWSMLLAKDLAISREGKVKVNKGGHVPIYNLPSQHLDYAVYVDIISNSFFTHPRVGVIDGIVAPT